MDSQDTLLGCMPIHHAPFFSALLLTVACASPQPRSAIHEPAVDPTTARIDSFLLTCAEAGFNGSVLVLRDPLFDLKAHRDQLPAWAQRKGEEGATA